MGGWSAESYAARTSRTCSPTFSASGGTASPRSTRTTSRSETCSSARVASAWTSCAVRACTTSTPSYSQCCSSLAGSRLRPRQRARSFATSHPCVCSRLMRARPWSGSACANCTAAALRERWCLFWAAGEWRPIRGHSTQDASCSLLAARARNRPSWANSAYAGTGRVEHLPARTEHPNARECRASRSSVAAARRRTCC